MQRLIAPIKNYEWGSRSVLARLQGRAWPTEQPEAELWLGAHASAPARLADGPASDLLELITAAPQRALGPEVLARFGAKLPFLLKLLAAERPLSLQAHPSPEQARAGYAREQAEGLELSSPRRCYKDESHKPEILCALTPFEALAGFREPREALELLTALRVTALEPSLAPLRAAPTAAGLAESLRALLLTPAVERAGLVRAAVEAARELRSSAPHRLVARLGELYPGDIGVIVSVLLEQRSLSPGQALYLPAGVLHAYLEGAGVELMASSDNVLRGGLSAKHVDAPELLRVLNFDASQPVAVDTETVGPELVYLTPAPEFRLSRVRLEGGPAHALAPRGPELWLVVEGEATLGAPSGQRLHLSAGHGAFTAAAEAPLTVEGVGVAFRATVGDAALRSRGEA